MQIHREELGGTDACQKSLPEFGAGQISSRFQWGKGCLCAKFLPTQFKAATRN